MLYFDCVVTDLEIGPTRGFGSRGNGTCLRETNFRPNFEGNREIRQCWGTGNIKTYIRCLGNRGTRRTYVMVMFCISSSQCRRLLRDCNNSLPYSLALKVQPVHH